MPFLIHTNVQHTDIITLNIRDLIPHPRNPRKISQEDLNRLCDSIRQNGYWQHRPMAVEPVPDKPGKYYILDGILEDPDIFTRGNKS